MSNGILVLSEQELRKFVQLDMKVIEKIELGFSELAAGKATVPPIMMLPVPEKNGEVDIKSAFIKGLPSMAIKIASGFFQNPDIGLPSQSGQMLVVSAETGFLEEAGKIQKEAIEIYENLLEENSENVGYQVELSVALSNLGSFLLMQYPEKNDIAKQDAAKQNLKRALEIQENILSQQPDNEKIKGEIELTRKRLENL